MPFSPGYSATFSMGGSDISIYTKDVKFNPVRKDFDLPVLGGVAVKAMVGPVKTTVDLQGFIDPTLTALMTAKMAEVVPVVVAIVFRPQGASVGPSRSANAFLIMYDENTPSEGPGAWTAKFAVDGLVTYG